MTPVLPCMIMSWFCVTDGSKLCLRETAKDHIDNLKWKIHTVGSNLSALPECYAYGYDKEEMAKLLDEVIKNATSMLPSIAAQNRVGFNDRIILLIEVGLLAEQLNAISRIVQSILPIRKSWRRPIKSLKCLPFCMTTIEERCKKISVIRDEMQRCFLNKIYDEIHEGMKVLTTERPFSRDVAVLVGQYLGIEEYVKDQTEAFAHGYPGFKKDAHEPFKPEEHDIPRRHRLVGSITIDVKHVPRLSMKYEKG